MALTGGAGVLARPAARRLDESGPTTSLSHTAEHDLRDPESALRAVEGSEVVIHLAARVGGIGFNRRNPAPLVYDNLMIGANVFEQARLAGVRKLVAACTVCAYPKFTPVPFSEAELWNGYPEESNAPYGLAKKMLLVLSDAYRRQYGFDSCAPIIANLYGPGDNYDLEDSHVIAALIRKFVEARDAGTGKVVLWGSGEPTREFLYVDDAARALLLAAERLETSEPVNIGTGQETRIRDLAETIRRLTGFDGDVVWDASKPDGQPARYLDVSRARELLDFEAEVSLDEGLLRTIESFERDRPVSAVTPA